MGCRAGEWFLGISDGEEKRKPYQRSDLRLLDYHATCLLSVKWVVKGGHPDLMNFKVKIQPLLGML